MVRLPSVGFALWAYATSPSTSVTLQNGFAERLIGSIRRERVDHFIVSPKSRRICAGSCEPMSLYYNDIRMHRSLNKDAPAFRPLQWVVKLNYTPSSVKFINTMFEFKFSGHTALYLQQIADEVIE